MLRFAKNRWWAFILALCLFTVGFLALTAQTPSVCRASDSGPSFTTETDPPPSCGDPDIPTGPGAGKGGRGWVTRGGLSPTTQTLGSHPTGEGMTSTSAVVDRFRLFLLGLRSQYFRF
jgi:hypothetical protein